MPAFEHFVPGVTAAVAFGSALITKLAAISMATDNRFITSIVGSHRPETSGAGRARTDDDGIMSSEAMTGSSTVKRG